MPKTFASLFTGGGLADIGAMQAGYTLLWGVANANLPHRDTVHAASVIGFDWASVERPDHLHMSPPCQDYSVAKTSGKVGNDNDALATACIEALTALKPSTVTLENVEGYRKAPGFQQIVDHLWGAGYWVNVDVLNSADFGVPQTRRRLILRAVKGGFPGPLPEPVKWRGWYEAIDDLIPELPETQFAAWQLKRLPESFIYGNGTYSTPISSHKPAQTITSNGNQTGVRAYLVESKNSNQQYGDGIRQQGEPHTTVITDPAGRVVRMTPRCLARFQSVPDDYVLPEKTALACKIIGNGVPCLMMQRVLESLR